MAKKILIVEDDKFLRELIAQKLQKENYEIVEAMDGEEGLKKIKEEKPDLILLDLILPEIDGFAVLRQIKEDPILAQIPVIILSNLGQETDIKRGLSLGAKDYLVKTETSFLEVVNKVKKLLLKNSLEK